MRTQEFARLRDAPSAVVDLGLPSKHIAPQVFLHFYTLTETLMYPLPNSLNNRCKFNVLLIS